MAADLGFDERVQELAALGFTPRQTRFLVTVALHGGYCLRRHYVTFAGIQYGKNVRDFLDTLVERSLAERVSFRDGRGFIYHVRAKSLYRRIGQGENRNRRYASSALMARKLMVLDFVLSRPDAEWFATEQDKVSLFADRFGIGLADLPAHVFTARASARPATTRFFMDKLPIFIATNSPAVQFVYLALDRTGRGLETFLSDHVRLLSRLPEWAIVAIGPPSLDVAVQRAAFDRFVQNTWRPESRASVADMRFLFAGLQAMEVRDLRQYSVADLDRLRELRKAYSTPRYRALYSAWCARGDAALGNVVAEETPSLTPAGRLIVCPLASTFSQFGSHPGVA
jgi:hypothetical protein